MKVDVKDNQANAKLRLITSYPPLPETYHNKVTFCRRMRHLLPLRACFLCRVRKKAEPLPDAMREVETTRVSNFDHDHHVVTSWSMDFSDRKTDRQTERQTDRHAFHLSSIDLHLGLETSRTCSFWIQATVRGFFSQHATHSGYISYCSICILNFMDTVEPGFLKGVRQTY